MSHTSDKVRILPKAWKGESSEVPEKIKAQGVPFVPAVYSGKSKRPVAPSLAKAK